MAIYVMSDVHGEYDKFMKMLDMINFSDSDELIILGDIFDRGPKPLEVLEYIVTHENVELVLGNHEGMFLDAYKNDFVVDMDVWFMNGGEVTFNALMAKGQAYIDECYKYLKRRPRYIRYKFDHGWAVIDIILCHAGIAIPPTSLIKGNSPTADEIIKFQTDNDWIWNRDHLFQDVYLDNAFVICGHTPVQAIEHGKKDILTKCSMIYIDCGAGFEDGRLACINLNKGEVIPYYVV